MVFCVYSGTTDVRSGYTSTGGYTSKNGSSDKIFILDLHSNVGWVEVTHLRCPLASNYVAVLTEDDDVHIMTNVNTSDEPKHYAVSISTILGVIGGVAESKKKKVPQTMDAHEGSCAFGRCHDFENMVIYGVPSFLTLNSVRFHEPTLCFCGHKTYGF